MVLVYRPALSITFAMSSVFICAVLLPTAVTIALTMGLIQDHSECVRSLHFLFVLFHSTTTKSAVCPHSGMK